MKRTSIELMYYHILDQLPEDAEIRHKEVRIVEEDGELRIGLWMEYYVPDEFPELDNAWPVEGTQLIVIKDFSNKPLTYRQLIKTSKIWNALIKKGSLLSETV